jgi:2-iminobutanoate/2-iminopropanoate deaminase
MQKIEIKVKGAPKPVARYSQGIVVNHTLYVQGVIALDPESGKLIDSGIENQTKRVFDSIRAIVEGAGMRMADIVKVTVFLSDLADYQKFNEVYNSYFPYDPPPVRTTVQAKMPFGALMEAEAVAYKAKI